jgi:hypothetical protein
VTQGMAGTLALRFEGVEIRQWITGPVPGDALRVVGPTLNTYRAPGLLVTRKAKKHPEQVLTPHNSRLTLDSVFEN